MKDHIAVKGQDGTFTAYIARPVNPVRCFTPSRDRDGDHSG
jgi:hypothetical protein